MTGQGRWGFWRGYRIPMREGSEYFGLNDSGFGYVGITSQSDPWVRVNQHRSKWWASEVRFDRAVIVDIGLMWESEAEKLWEGPQIATDKPPFNSEMNRGLGSRLRVRAEEGRRPVRTPGVRVPVLVPVLLVALLVAVAVASL